MGDIIQKFRVRSLAGGRGRPLRLYFDTGSAHSFVRQSVAKRLGGSLELGEPKAFGGLGDGRFKAGFVLYFEIRLLEFWCGHIAYVVEDRVLGDDYDMLIGHGLMQPYNILCNPRKRRVILDPATLRRAQKVHSPRML